MKKLFLIHGRGFKPQRDKLRKIWLDALRYGITRDFGDGSAERLDGVCKEFVYYGDLSNKFLRKRGREYDEEKDLEKRLKTLDTLTSYEKEDFNKSKYHEISSPLRWLREAGADLLAGPTHALGIGDNLIGHIKPDMRHYWRVESRYGSDVRWRLTEPLRDAFRDRYNVMVVGHSLGTIIAYDVLWKFSHYGEYQDIRDARVTHFVTLGSPLGNPVVIGQLKGNQVSRGVRRYPTNIATWSNVAAEDDMVCHDEALQDDFQDIQNTNINDYQIYNLSEKDGQARQHHSSGYLIHPKTSEIVYSWLRD